MADMNAGIILQGQTPDIMGSFARGMTIRAQRNALAQQEDLANLYRAQGAQILAGEQQALNALAGIDPTLAMGVQQGQLGMDATRHGMRMDEANLAMRQEELSMAKENARLRGLEFAAQIDAQTAAQAAAELDRALAMASMAQSPEQWDAVMAQLGPDGQQYVGQFENRDMIIAGALGLKEALKMRPEAPKPTADMIEFDYAQKNPAFADYQKEQKKAGATNVTTTVGLPGEGAASGDALRASMTDAETVLGMIDRIAMNPALPKVTGAVEGGGGNNVDEMNVLQRAWYGDDGLALIQEIGQLQGNAWLGARALLKGAGQITDYESKKAEGAMARLSRAQGTAEFRAALKDLRDALTDGLKKLQAAQEQGAPAVQGDAGASLDFSKMGLAEIGQVDIGSLTPEQMDALERRMTELGL